jgi:hypothetical protein
VKVAVGCLLAKERSRKAKISRDSASLAEDLRPGRITSETMITQNFVNDVRKDPRHLRY